MRPQSFISPLSARRQEKVVLIEYPLSNSSQFERLFLQYWPESLTDNKSVDYETKSIPGSTVPIKQWIFTGERTISFNATLVSEINEKDLRLISRQFLRLTNPDKYCVDINKAIVWLRRFLYPEYDKVLELVKPPSSLLVYFPKTQLGYKEIGNYVGAILCYMTQCNVTYDAWFPDGTPRIANVSLEFQEIVTNYNRDFWPDINDLNRLLI